MRWQELLLMGVDGLKVHRLRSVLTMLGIIFGVAAVIAMLSIGEGAKLLTAYSAGLAIPFLLAALGIGWVTHILQRYRKVMHIVEIVMGIVMIIVGVMLFLGTFEQLARFGFFVDFGI